MMTSNDTVTVLLCGVGGQGTILAADLLAHAALESGYDAKVSEIHGMSQRGGAVTTVVRFGRAGVQSMVSDPGCADCVVSFETTEALRNLPNVREGGYLLVADETLQPLPVLIGRASMPEHARETLAAAGATLIPAGDIAVGVGAPKSVNVVLLGALATASTSRKRHGSASSRAACLPRPSMPTWQRFARASRSLARLRAGKGLKT